MAELMSQAEIDELLKSSVGDEGGGGDDDFGGDDDSQESSKTIKKSKTFSAPKKKELRFHFPYQSPVLKSESYAYNPDPQADPPSDTPVVRTLSNFMEYLKKKNQEFA